MYENVSVEQAISRGNRMVNYPVFAIMVSIGGISFLLNGQFGFPPWVIGLAVPGCIVLPWIYWSYMITKWRIWAFENVRNVHELKKKAIEAKLIWPDGSFWEKTEIRSSSDKEKLKSLESKFEQPDVFADDYSVPSETIVRFSKWKSYGALVLGLVMVAVGIYLYIVNTYFVSVIGSLAGCYMIYQGFKNGTNSTPQIIINNNGIQTYRTPFRPWSNIRNEDVTTHGSGRSTKFYFVYEYTGGSEEMEIAEYDINRARLGYLLHVYRLRSKKKNKQQVL